MSGNIKDKDKGTKPQNVLNRVMNKLASALNVAIRGYDGSAYPVLRTTSLGHLYINKLVPEEYDSIELSYTGTNLTGVVYKLGVTTIATLTLAYTGSRLDSVTKS